MSLLEKASGGSKKKVAQSHARTSLFLRAIAASHPEPEPVVGEVSAEPQDIPQEHLDAPHVPEPEPESPAANPRPSPLFETDVIASLKESILALNPAQDSMLFAWSLISSELPLQAIALFLPHGDFLASAAQIGFPSCKGDDIPLSIAPAPQNNGTLLDDESKALVAPILGVSVGMALRAVSVWSDSAIVGLWIIHDDQFEASSDETRVRLIDLFAESAASLPSLTIASPPADPLSASLASLKKYRFATALRFDLDDTYSDRPMCRGISARTVLSAFLSAFAVILEQTGSSVALGEGSIVGFIGSSSLCDPELSLFQFTKTAKRCLPFLSAEAFPVGSSTSFDMSSELVDEKLSAFLAK
jgi:hypothetical protein